MAWKYVTDVKIKKWKQTWLIILKSYNINKYILWLTHKQ